MSTAKVAINWPKVLSRCRPEVHKKIMEARGRHEELRRLISETHTPSINFDAYRKALPASAHKFLAEMEAKAKSFKISKVDTVPLLEALKVERAQKMSEAEDFLVNLDQHIARVGEKLAKLKASKPIEQLSIDEVYEMRPELQESFQQAMKEDNWSTVEETAEEKAAAAALEAKHH